MNLWDILLVQPLTSLLLLFYVFLGRNLGLAIIGLTALLRILLFPFVLPSLRSVQKQRELKPRLDKIRKKYKDDPQKLAQAQLDLFREAGINPFAGCLPQIMQVLVLVALYSVLAKAIADPTLNIRFLVWDLSRSDPYFIFPALAAVAQFLLARITLPSVSEGEVAAEATKDQADDFATAMQKQNLFLFPLLTLVIGFKLPAGVMLYWLVTSFIQLGLQWWAMRRA